MSCLELNSMIDPGQLNGIINITDIISMLKMRSRWEVILTWTFYWIMFCFKTDENYPQFKSAKENRKFEES